MKPNVRLKVKLLERGLSQRDLSFGTEISESEISKAVRHGKATPEVRRKICRFLGVAESELFPK
jgi:DNA-binding Xre family transcriptional regulator